MAASKNTGRDAATAELTPDLKELIVVRLATFERPTDIIKELQKDHGVKVSLQQLTVYNPGTHTGRRLSPELTELFQKTRARYHAELSDLALGSAAGRARFLTAVAEAALENRQAGRAMEAVELIAKDLGGQFSARAGRPLAADGAEGTPGANADADGGAAERAARTAAILDAGRARRDLSPPVAAGDGDAPA